MKESELRKHTKCGVCGKKIGHTGLPLFYRVTVERFGIDMGAVQRQTGLAMMFNGNAVLAAAMGPDEDMAKPICDPVVVTVCEDCSTKPVLVAALGEE